MLTVSNYHYIRPDFSAPFPSIFGLTPTEFRSHLRHLATAGIIVRPDELRLHYRDILESKKNYLLITFDDGLREQFEYALPILGELGVEALFFINSANHQEKRVSLVHQIHLVRSVFAPDDLLERLNQFRGFPPNLHEQTEASSFYRFDTPAAALTKYLLNVSMSVEEQLGFVGPLFHSFFSEEDVHEALYMKRDSVAELCASGMTGSHSHSHLPLGLYPDQVVASELEATIGFLRSMGASHTDFVAYPYGTEIAAPSRVGRIAEKVGHTIGFTTKSAINTGVENPLLLSRFDCNDLRPA